MGSMTWLQTQGWLSEHEAGPLLITLPVVGSLHDFSCHRRIGKNLEDHCSNSLVLHVELDDQYWATLGGGADFILKAFKCPDSSALLTEPITSAKVWARLQLLKNKVYISDDKNLCILQISKIKRSNKEENITFNLVNETPQFLTFQ